ncbi:MAG: Gfo/Idh/MocA family oxidoreductase [Acidimicrobiia bacterium]|nr:Gfo/Idh/MocA family oxidoreductase [Acidimicrobiia bacterium]
MAVPTLNIALLGSKFMGKVHSNAWLQANHFFDLPSRAVLHTIAARDGEYLERFADQWGWANWTTDWQEAIADPAVDLVDVGTPNHLHREQAVAALEAGMIVACEKPLAGTLDDAREMRDAARRNRAPTFVWYNYRRAPALALAHQLVAEGRLGRIYHVRAAYLQSWGGPDSPLTWRFQKNQAGSGSLGDLMAHIVDMARFVTGDEIAEVGGAIEERFIKQRPRPDDPTLSGRSSVDDAVLFVARFRGGAVGSFESTRMATGVKNSNRIEIHGESGAVRFNFERMNELEFFDDRESPRLQGWRTIQAMHEDHPYAANWWPDGHWLGYEHTFVNQAADIVVALNGGVPVVPLPDFEDAFTTQRVMEAAVLAARNRTSVKLSEVK